MKERPIPDEAALAALLDAAAKVHGLTVEPEWREACLVHLKATAAAAELVLAFPLDDETEPAPVFSP